MMIQSCITIYSLGNVDQLITHRTDTFNCIISIRMRRSLSVILTYSYFRFMGNMALVYLMTTNVKVIALSKSKD